MNKKTCETCIHCYQDDRELEDDYILLNLCSFDNTICGDICDKYEE